MKRLIVGALTILVVFGITFQTLNGNPPDTVVETTVLADTVYATITAEWTPSELNADPAQFELFYKWRSFTLTGIAEDTTVQFSVPKIEVAQNLSFCVTPVRYTDNVEGPETCQDYVVPPVQMGDRYYLAYDTIRFGRSNVLPDNDTIPEGTYAIELMRMDGIWDTLQIPPAPQLSLPGVDSVKFYKDDVQWKNRERTFPYELDGGGNYYETLTEGVYTIEYRVWGDSAESRTHNVIVGSPSVEPPDTIPPMVPLPENIRLEYDTDSLIVIRWDDVERSPTAEVTYHALLNYNECTPDAPDTTKCEIMTNYEPYYYPREPIPDPLQFCIQATIWEPIPATPIEPPWACATFDWGVEPPPPDTTITPEPATDVHARFWEMPSNDPAEPFAFTMDWIESPTEAIYDSIYYMVSLRVVEGILIPGPGVPDADGFWRSGPIQCFSAHTSCGETGEAVTRYTYDMLAFQPPPDSVVVEYCLTTQATKPDGLGLGVGVQECWDGFIPPGGTSTTAEFGFYASPWRDFPISSGDTLQDGGYSISLVRLDGSELVADSVILLVNGIRHTVLYEPQQACDFLTGCRNVWGYLGGLQFNSVDNPNDPDDYFDNVGLSHEVWIGNVRVEQRSTHINISDYMHIAMPLGLRLQPGALGELQVAWDSIERPHMPVYYSAWSSDWRSDGMGSIQRSIQGVSDTTVKISFPTEVCVRAEVWDCGKCTGPGGHDLLDMKEGWVKNIPVSETNCAVLTRQS